MLHYAVAWWLWAHGTPGRRHFPEIARHSGKQCSIGFQPVSGFGAEPGSMVECQPPVSGREPSQTALENENEND